MVKDAANIRAAMTSCDGSLVLGQQGLDSRTQGPCHHATIDPAQTRRELERPHGAYLVRAGSLRDPDKEVHGFSECLLNPEVGAPDGGMHSLPEQGSRKSETSVVRFVRLPVQSWGAVARSKNAAGEMPP